MTSSGAEVAAVTTDRSSAIARARDPRVRAWLDAFQPRLLIDNEWVPAKSGDTFESIDPASEGRLAVVASGHAEDVDAAVRAARRAFEEGPWSRLGPAERAKLLRTYAGLLEDNAAELAELESLDSGIILSFAKGLIGGAVEALHYYAGAANLVSGETIASDPTFLNYTLREPLGVCAAIIPWNAPIDTAIKKIAPALAAGNTIVLKPAEQTPLTAIRLGELALEAGFPPGVLNIVTGYGQTAGAALVEHPDVDKIGFTGSTEVGKRILVASAANLKRVTLELGGKSPNIVFADADMEQAVPAAMRGYAALAGQVCCAGTRVFVQQDVKDEFVDGLVRFTETIKLGDPLDADTTLGPLVSKQQYDRVQGYFEIGVAEGATARTGGAAEEGAGYFVQPTVFDDVDNSMRIAREEIFGPVVSVIPFRDEYDAVLQGNDTSYGLAAAIWTSDVTRAHTVARRIKAGTVWINTILKTSVSMPFGGYKQSGVGREGGPNWYEEYTQEKAVYLKL
jgi:acyl-CoA reductase-like NAD-dependent aldehyde dehydrogenase